VSLADYWDRRTGPWSGQRIGTRNFLVSVPQSAELWVNSLDEFDKVDLCLQKIMLSCAMEHMTFSYNVRITRCCSTYCRSPPIWCYLNDNKYPEDCEKTRMERQLILISRTNLDIAVPVFIMNLVHAPDCDCFHPILILFTFLRHRSDFECKVRFQDQPRFCTTMLPRLILQTLIQQQGPGRAGTTQGDDMWYKECLLGEARST
jgi:hypothetical protein